MAIELLGKKCMPCEGGVPPIKGTELTHYLSSLATAWDVVDDKKIKKVFIFKDFKESVKFVNQVAELAENEGHHPDIIINYNKVTIELWTHAIMGLSENDFILAAKIERVIPNIRM